MPGCLIRRHWAPDPNLGASHPHTSLRWVLSRQKLQACTPTVSLWKRGHQRSINCAKNSPWRFERPQTGSPLCQAMQPTQLSRKRTLEWCCLLPQQSCRFHPPLSIVVDTLFFVGEPPLLERAQACDWHTTEQGGFVSYCDTQKTGTGLRANAKTTLELAIHDPGTGSCAEVQAPVCDITREEAN